MAKTRNPYSNMEWRYIATGRSSNAVAIPETEWQRAHEIMIQWRMHSNNAWSYLVLESAKGSAEETGLICDSFFFSDQYRACATWEINIADHTLTPVSASCAGMYGTTALTVSSLIYYVYLR